MPKSYSLHCYFNFLVSKPVSISMVESDDSCATVSQGADDLVMPWGLSSHFHLLLSSILQSLIILPGAGNASENTLVILVIVPWIRPSGARETQTGDGWNEGLSRDDGAVRARCHSNMGDPREWDFSPWHWRWLCVMSIWFTTSQHQEHPLMWKGYI